MMKKGLLLVGLLCVVPANPARAGIFDTPLPSTLPANGGKPKLIYAITGLRTLGTDISAVIHCTNIGKKTAEVAVEFFDFEGELENDVAGNNGVRTIGVGQTRTFVANRFADPAGPYLQDEFAILDGDLAQGSARILADQKKLLCSAQVVDDANDEIVDVPVFHRGKQRGD